MCVHERHIRSFQVFSLFFCSHWFCLERYPSPFSKPIFFSKKKKKKMFLNPPFPFPVYFSDIPKTDFLRHNHHPPTDFNPFFLKTQTQFSSAFKLFFKKKPSTKMGAFVQNTQEVSVAQRQTTALPSCTHNKPQKHTPQSFALTREVSSDRSRAAVYAEFVCPPIVMG